MINKDAWIIKCDNCQKEYNIPKDTPSRLEEVYGEKRLVLEFRPECPYCKTYNSRIAVRDNPDFLQILTTKHLFL